MWRPRRWILPLAAVGLAGGIAFFGLSRRHRLSERDFLRNGQAYFDKKDYSGAILEFENAVQAAPGDAEAHYRLAQAYIRSGSAQLAVAHLIRATELNARHLGAQRDLARLMSVNQDPEVVRRAQERARTILGQAPGDPEGLRVLALTEFRLGQTKDAEMHLRQVLEKRPGDARSAALLAALLIKRNEAPAGEQILLQAAASDPRAPDAFLLLARFYTLRGQSELAEKQLRHVLEMDPQNGSALLNLGIELFRAKRTAEADEVFRRLSQLPGDRYQPIHAMFSLRMGKTGQAVTEFEQLARSAPNDRKARSRLAAAYVVARRPREAESLLAGALERSPSDETAAVQLSEVHLLMGKYLEAQNDLRPFLSAAGESPALHYALARVYRARGNRTEEIRELGTVLRLKPNLLAARVLLSQALIASRRPREAVDVMNQAPTGQRGARAAMVARNWALIAAGDWEEAGKGIERTLADRSAPDALLQRALLRIRQKDYQAALKLSEQALKESPDDPRALEMAARALAAANRGSSALAMIRDHVSSRSASAEMQYLLGIWSLAGGERQEARAALSAAGKANPRFAPAQVALAQLNALEGDPAAERDRLAAVLAQDSRDVSAHLMLAELDEQNRNYRSAIEHYRDALDADPSNVQALNNLAYRLINMQGHIEEALQLAQQAESLAPNNPAVKDTLGWVLYSMGDYRAALQYLDKAVAGGRSPLRQYHLAMACLRTGDRTRAQEAARVAVEMGLGQPEARELNELLPGVLQRSHPARIGGTTNSTQ